MAALVDVVAQHELRAVVEHAPHRGRAALRRDLGERLERLDDAHVAGVASPAHLPGLVGPAGRRLAVAVVEARVGREPVDAGLHARVVEHAQADEAEDQVAGQAGDDAAVQAAALLLGAVGGKAAGEAVLRVAQDRLAPASHALVGAVGAELGEDEELPDRAAVLGRVEAVAALPVAVLALRGEDRGTAPRDMISRRAAVASGESGDDPSSPVRVKKRTDGSSPASSQEKISELSALVVTIVGILLLRVSTTSQHRLITPPCDSV